MGWVLTKGLEHLRGQVDEAFPDRSKASDGTVGDLAHQLESASGHNPDITGRAEYRDGDNLNEVRAWDMTSDLRHPGVTAQDVVDHIRALPGVAGVLRYMIYNRKIYEADNGWRPRAYSGPSPHTEHIHFSGARSQAADSNTAFDYRLEDLVAVTAADITKIADAVWAKLLLTPYDGVNRKAGDLLRYAPSRDGIANAVDTKLAVKFSALLTAAGADHVDEAAIAQAVLAGMNYQQIASAVIAALPPDQAKQVVNELSIRLATSKG